MNQRVLGLDVSKDNVVACLLDEFPAEPRQLYLSYPFERLYANTTGIKRLLEFQPHVAVLEPTGVNYARIWATKLAEAGVKIALVGHRQLRTYRFSMELEDKDDEADSLCLACYYLQYHNSPSRFVRQRDELIAELREHVLRLHHLNRVQSPIINRLKQDLAWGFPEKAKVDVDARVFWRWIAGEAKSAKYDALVTRSCGLGITENMRFNAKLLTQLHNRETEIELKIREILSDFRFLSYRKVFKTYGFGERTEALLLSQIYPIENYLQNGQPIVIESRSRENPTKTTKKRLSVRKFQKALGASPAREWSGDGKASKKAGSQLCRTALWQWVFTRVEAKRCRLKNPTFLALAEEYERLKQNGVPTKLVRSKVIAKAAKRLFYDLVNNLEHH